MHTLAKFDIEISEMVIYLIFYKNMSNLYKLLVKLLY